MSPPILSMILCLALAAAAAAQGVRVSVSTSGAQGTGPSDSPSISGTGRYVVFASSASNLVDGDTNFLPDIFLRDRDVDTDGVFDEAGAVSTTRLNVAPGGVQANNASYTPTITPDGRYVCFVSKATNLVPPTTPVPGEVLQVYRLDRTTGSIVLVSRAAAGTAGELHSREPAISDDGDVVAFSSEASTLISGPQNPYPEIFLREIQAGRTTRASPLPAAPFLFYEKPTISADGRRVFFQGYPVTQGTRTYYASVYDWPAGIRRDLPDGMRAPGILSADGRAAIVTHSGLRRMPLDLGPETLDYLIGAGDVLATSADARYVLTAAGLVVDADLDAMGPFGPSLVSGAFDRTGRWIVVAGTQRWSLTDDDTNDVSDVYVVDLPDRLDFDDDGMADYWESYFQQSDPGGDPDGDGLTNAQEFAAGSHPNGVHRRFLAEGATGDFFATDIALANPDAQQLNRARVVLTFDAGDGRRLRRTLALDGLTSSVIHAGAVRGLEAADFSTTIESD